MGCLTHTKAVDVIFFLNGGYDLGSMYEMARVKYVFIFCSFKHFMFVHPGFSTKTLQGLSLSPAHSPTPQKILSAFYTFTIYGFVWVFPPLETGHDLASCYNPIWLVFRHKALTLCSAWLRLQSKENSQAVCWRLPLLAMFSSELGVWSSVVSEDDSLVLCLFSLVPYFAQEKKSSLFIGRWLCSCKIKCL